MGIRAAQARGENLGLSDDEVTFDGALETSDSAVPKLGDETLKKGYCMILVIARKA